jgi:predicted lipoprotein
MTMEAVPRRAPRAGFGRIVAGVAVIAVLAAMAYDTRVVRIGSDEHVQDDVFSPETFGTTEFPKIQTSVESRAVEAATLAPAALADKAAAGKQYGVPAGAAPVVPVKFTGVAGEARSGVYPITVEGVPSDVTIRLQTGPAINGTDLRDATGEIVFGQFRNQIEYQNAGSGLNNAMKAAVLQGVDTANLQGKTVTAVGVFKLINPKNWLVTPVGLSVQ